MSVSPGVLSPQLLLGGEELDAVLQLEEGLLLGLVVHALVLLKVLHAAKQTTESRYDTTPVGRHHALTRDESNGAGR